MNVERMNCGAEKSDLYSSLWSRADELRGSMDASQYKDYVLTLLFVKYVSDKAKADPIRKKISVMGSNWPADGLSPDLAAAS